MDWKKFQEVTAQTFRQIGCDVNEDVSVEGARAKHDVDVLVSFDTHGFKVKWVLECKAWNTNIPKEKVMALKSIVEDVGADKGFIISKIGFQAGAIASAQSTNIELITLDELKQVISGSVVPFISFPEQAQASVQMVEAVSDSVLNNLRNPKPETHPEIYREYLILSGCQKTQKAAAAGLSKIPSTDSVVLLVERLGNFWGVGSIKSAISALSKLSDNGSILGLLATLLLDSRFYYEKLEAVAKALKKTGDLDTQKLVQSILNSRLHNGMEMSYRLSKKVPSDVRLLLSCQNDDVIHGLVLASFFNQSIWAEDVLVKGAVDKSIEYADKTIPGLIEVINGIDLLRWHQI